MSAPNPFPNPALQPAAGQQQQQRKREKRDVSGWVVLDKPVGMTSTHAVARVKRAFQAKKAGHAGTLDPLASGLLPIALGEATKTVPFVMDGRKRYRFTVRWGIETDTDDSEGRAIATSEVRPSPDAVRAALPQFTGAISQVPPKFSAIKIEGERAYDLARDGEAVELEPRTVEIHRARAHRNAGCRPCGVRGRVRQGHLCASARARPWPHARQRGPCRGAAAHDGRLVQRDRRGRSRRLSAYGEAAAAAQNPLTAIPAPASRQHCTRCLR